MVIVVQLLSIVNRLSDALVLLQQQTVVFTSAGCATWNVICVSGTIVVIARDGFFLYAFDLLFLLLR